ncbi:MAG: TonB-dependent receptor [Prevotellaceae bacterium]|nr:TonB-dependent receptor [Prevotellaceae bacterium]
MYKQNSFKRESLRFKHFSRKGYSLFACLGKEVLIGTLSVATLTYAKAEGISTRVEKADSTTQTTGKAVMLDEIDVTGTRAPLTAGHAARMVTVLDSEAIAAAPVQSVNDLLKYVAGVDVRQRGAIGAQTDVSVRGGTYEHITILLNGINICDPQTGHNAFDLPVDVSEIERIEVLEGPAGRVYGTSSLVGAINIITRPKHESSVDVRAEGGSYGYASGSGRINLKSGKWNNQVSGSYQRSDGFQRSASGHLNSDYEGGKAFYQGRYDDESVTVSWHAGMSIKGWGSNTFYSVKSDEQYEHTNKYFTAIQAETKGGKFHFRPSIYWNRYQDRYEFYRGLSDKSSFNYNRTDVFGVNLNSWFDWALGRTAFGAEFRNEDLISGNLGETLDNPIHIHGTDRDYTLGLNRSNLSFHLEHNVMLNRFTLSAGFIAVKNTWNEMPFKIYPGVDASYRIGDNWKVYASFNMSLRMPSFTELYYKKDGHNADKYLKPEEMSAVEAGVKYIAEGVNASVAVYHHHGTNMIDWIMDTSLGDEAVWTSVNHTKINALGVEASASLDFTRLIPSQRFLHSFNVSYSYINQDQDREENIVSLYALEYLRHKLVSGLSFSLTECIKLNVNYRYQYRIGSYTNASGETFEYEPYSLVDARLSWDKPSYGVYLNANNVFDKDYVDYGNVVQPGFWFVAGVKLHFKL